MDKELFAQRLNKLRVDSNMTLRDISSQILEKTGVKIAPSSILKWEKGEFMPHADRINILANFFNVSPDWLAGNSSKMEIGVPLTDTYKPVYIEKEDLYRFRGEPVWIQIDDQKRWAIVSENEDEIYLSTGEIIPFYQVKGVISRFPAPFCYGIDATKKPIPRSRINGVSTVWVEKIGSVPAKRKKGWYDRDMERNCFTGRDGERLSLQDYAVTWIAFEDIN